MDAPAREAASRNTIAHEPRATRPIARGGLGYLINQYPKVSHSFIRREILALEEQGWSIFRVALRGWDAELVDPADLVERGKTTFVLERNVFSLIWAVARQAVRAPTRFFAALRLAMQMRHPSERPPLWHLIYLAEACWLVPRLAERKITHLHAHFATNSAEVAMLVGVLADIGYSFTVHGTGEYDKATLNHLAEKVRRAEFVVVVCSYVRAQILRVTPPEDWPKVKLVRCGIDPTFAEAYSVVPADSVRLVCVGRLSEEKGQILLVKAVAALRQEGRRFELVLVGDGEHREPIERLIAERGLSGVVTITGWAAAADVRREILAARALVLPSFAEGLPIVLIEAMLLARPVLSTYVGGIPELVVDGKTGWLFPAGSEADIVRAIRACLDAPIETLRAMGAAGRERALRLHRLQDQASTLSDLFTEAVAKRRNACSPSWTRS